MASKNPLLQALASLADLKELDYQHTLALDALVDLLVEKGVFSSEEFIARTIELDRQALPRIVAPH